MYIGSARSCASYSSEKTKVSQQEGWGLMETYNMKGAKQYNIPMADLCTVFTDRCLAWSWIGNTVIVAAQAT